MLRVSQKSPATHGIYQAIRSNVLPQWDCFHSGIVCREARTYLQTCHVCHYVVLIMNLGYIIGISVHICHNLFNQTPLCTRLRCEKGTLFNFHVVYWSVKAMDKFTSTFSQYQSCVYILSPEMSYRNFVNKILKVFLLTPVRFTFTAQTQRQ
jgi:hypothetical protein